MWQKIESAGGDKCIIRRERRLLRVCQEPSYDWLGPTPRIIATVIQFITSTNDSQQTGTFNTAIRYNRSPRSFNKNLFKDSIPLTNQSSSSCSRKRAPRYPSQCRQNPLRRQIKPKK